MLHLLSHEEANVTIEQWKNTPSAPTTCSRPSLPMLREGTDIFYFVINSTYPILFSILCSIYIKLWWVSTFFYKKKNPPKGRNYIECLTKSATSSPDTYDKVVIKYLNISSINHPEKNSMYLILKELNRKKKAQQQNKRYQTALLVHLSIYKKEGEWYENTKYMLNLNNQFERPRGSTSNYLFRSLQYHSSLILTCYVHFFKPKIVRSQ